MSSSTRVNSPLASGWSRSCWTRNWLRVIAGWGMRTSGLGGGSVVQAGDVLGGARHGGHGRDPGEGPGHEGRVLLGQGSSAGSAELLEQEGELLLERAA